jgi:NAD(P)-dependent dehydrogenase (short-subunit alcohol dehydrogenase family)
VTGAATGIGRAVAYRFAEAGASLDLVDIDGEGLQRVTDELAPFAVDVVCHTVDLCEKAAIDALWEALEGTTPEILVNNAGIYPLKGFLDTDAALLDQVLQINLTAVFWMCQHMIRRRLTVGGVIINIGSIEAVLPFKADLAHYALSKAGVMAFTRTLAREYGPRGFRVNALVPGGILTQGVKNTAKDILRLNFGLIKSGLDFRTRLPLRRFGRPDEVALMALVLASDLSSYVQGTLIPVDGGFLST